MTSTVPTFFPGRLAHVLRGSCEIASSHFVHPRSAASAELVLAPLTDLIEDLLVELEDEHTCSEVARYRERLAEIWNPEAPAEATQIAEHPRRSFCGAEMVDGDPCRLPKGHTYTHSPYELGDPEAVV